ncbi:MAG: hypothetical protein EHM41_20930 [Chloroflexi bacterium]|nr:MAG: hypothetical protein EHM41_20930 [Chloroflexota bacterium]
MSQPFKLFRIQGIDSQLDQARLKLQKIENELRDDAALQQAQALMDAADRKLAEAKKSLRSIEAEVQSQEVKVEQAEAALYGGKVRNPKELQDLEKESASIKKYISTLEDRQLDMMMALEEAEAEHQTAHRELQSVLDEKATRDSLLRAEQANLIKEFERLETERQHSITGLPQDDLQQYELLRKSRKGVAVARITDNACSACGSTLTPALVQAAHSPTQLVKCSFCGRILYAG